jgi:hypothetical protein
VQYGGARSELTEMRLETQELREQVKALVAEMRASPRPAVKDGYVANTFHEGLIPQDYFLDTDRDHAKRVGLAGKMASCRDKEKVKLKFLRSYFGSAMPHDSIGEFPMTEYVLKNVGVESREKMSELKLYTDALGARKGTGNEHSGHHLRHHYPGGEKIELMYVSMFTCALPSSYTSPKYTTWHHQTSSLFSLLRP